MSGTTVLIIILVITFLVVAQVRASGRGSRACPNCGRPVRREKLDCPRCGHDFRAVDELW